MNKKNLKLTLTLVVTFISISAIAGPNNGIDAATNEVKGYFEPAVKLMYAVGAVLGIIGGVKVYSKWNQGDPDTTKTAASWFGSCIFLVIVATLLKGFFL
jgi:hypothetical protein